MEFLLSRGYVLEKYRKSHNCMLIIVGHSYGTMLGSKYTLTHPDKVAAYIGVGQFVDIESDIYSYEDALDKAKAKGEYDYNAFGVCGTGLEQEEITVGGYSAWKGTYDNKKHWDHISLRNTPGSYVIMNEGADKWLGEYETELMQILDTINVAEGYISEGEAIEIAKKAIDVKYDEIRARFDSTNGFWRLKEKSLMMNI